MLFWRSAGQPVPGQGFQASRCGGEKDEEQRLATDLEAVLHVMWRIVGASTRLTWITAGYGWCTIVAPILFAAPGTQELLCSCQSGKTRVPTREGSYLWSCVTCVISWPWPRN